jgi:hypothetical protein
MKMYDEHSAWWDAPKNQPHEFLQSYLDTILQQNNRRFQDYVRYAGVYGNWDSVPLIGSFLATGIPYTGGFRRVTFNMTSSMVDTVINQRAAEYGRLMAESVDGDYMQFMMAKMLTQAIRQECELQDVEYKFSGVVRDALLFGRGVATVDKKGGYDTGTPARPVFRRQFSPEIVVDPYENVVDGWPFSFALCRFVSRQSVERKWPQHAGKISSAISEPGAYLRVRGDDNIRIDEAWVPTLDGKTGRHVICTNGVTLCDEPYDHEEPPFVSLAWQPPIQGWYARGLVDELLGLQMEVNQLLEIIHEAHVSFAHPYMVVEQNSNVNTHHIQDVPARILKYLTVKPEIVSSQMIAPEVYQHLERCYQKGYEIAGINPYVAQAKTLPRLESSKAQRSMQDMNDQRHFQFSRQCEEFVEKWAKLFCRVAMECDEENEYATRMPVSSCYPNIKWGDINYELDKYNIKLGTVNPLMGKTAEDLQEIQEAMGLAQLTPTQFRQYMDNPDVHRNASLITASDDYTDWAIYYMTVKPGEPMDVDPLSDKKAAITACIQHYLIGERLGWPEQVSGAAENLLNYIEQCKQALMVDQLEMQQRQMGLGPGLTEAMPGAPMPPTPNQSMGMSPSMQPQQPQQQQPPGGQPAPEPME